MEQLIHLYLQMKGIAHNDAELTAVVYQIQGLNGLQRKITPNLMGPKDIALRNIPLEGKENGQ